MFFFSCKLQNHALRVGQCLPRICTSTDIQTILDMDTSARKFSGNFQNSTNEMEGAGVRVISVRRVPGEYDLWSDRQFYLVLYVN